MAASLARAASPSTVFEVEGKRYDLSALNSPQTLEETADTPPSKTTTRFYVSLFDELPKQDVPDADQCPAGSRICAVIENEKPGVGGKRITNVIPIAGDYADSPLAVDAKRTSASDGELLITYAGGKYLDVSQRAEIIFECQSDAQEPTHPEFRTYSNGVLTLHWKTAHACPLGKDSPPGTPGTTPVQSSGRSVFSIFFWLVVLAFLAYFVVGSWINRTQYGASGIDMLPNRDFWRDLPFIVKEFFTPSRSARAGYSALG